MTSVILYVIIIIISSLLIGVTIGFASAAFLTQSFTIPILIAAVTAGTGIVILIFSVVNSILKSKRKPRLRYLNKRIDVRTSEDNTRERRFLYIDYYLTIENTAHGIKAKDCEGFITVLNTDIVKHKMLWESNRYEIDIGYEALLRLFEITETWDGQTLERRIITFSPNASEQLDHNVDVNGRRISIRIQSENAECPTKPFEIGIREAINSARAS
jgi:hypothetical protein